MRPLPQLLVILVCCTSLPADEPLVDRDRETPPKNRFLPPPADHVLNKDDANDAADPGMAPPPAKLAPAPDKSSQEKALAEIKSVLSDDYNKLGKPDLAKKLLSLAKGTANDPIRRYVLLMEAVKIAAAANDAPLSMEAVDTMAGLYEGPDYVRVKTSLLDRMATTANKDTAASLVRCLLSSADTFVTQDQYDAAEKLCTLAAGIVKRFRLRPFTETLKTQQKEIKVGAAEFAKYSEALETLKRETADESANATVGRYLALRKGDWTNGLPHLAKGNVPEMKSAATADLAKPTETAKQVDVGDQWWSLSENQVDTSKRNLQTRAAYWYRLATPNVTDEFSKTKLSKRLAEVNKQIGQEDVKAAEESNWFVLFRSADPTVWNTDTKQENSFAVPLATAPAAVKYLKLTRTDNGASVIIPMTKANLGIKFESGRHGWNGTNEFGAKGHHLGVLNVQWNLSDPVRSRGVGSLTYDRNGGDVAGWGFGHKAYADDTQMFIWAGKELASTVFEISVTGEKLTPAEQKLLLR